MANVESSTVLTQLNSLSQLHIVRQLTFMLIIAAGIALGTITVIWSTESDYTALFMNMAEQDAAEVIGALDQSNTDYKIDTRSGLISVPSNEVHQVRLQLASLGLPRDTNRGYAILEDEQSLGTSNFMQQARYNRALEQELVQTIKHIRAVREARVHLSIPKQTSFIRSAAQPSASVMIDLISPQALSNTQLLGILNLVTSSVSGLQSENVSIVDQQGNLLSQTQDSDLSYSSEQLRLTREIEVDYSRRIADILSPIVGAENVRTQVAADLDFTIIETTEESYNPNTAVIRSEQTQEETIGDRATAAFPEPGTLSASEPDAGQAAAQNPASLSSQSRINSTRNYEIDRSVSLIRTVPGNIRKLSVAVLVDLHGREAVAVDGETITSDPALDQQKLDRLTQLVRDAIGFDATRGDSVSVINEIFLAAPEIEPAAELELWEQPWFFTSAKQLGAGLIIILLIFGVLRPSMRAAVNNQSTLPSRLSGPGVVAGDDLIDVNPEIAALAAPAPPAKSEYDENLALAQTLVQTEPARAARMIQSWLANE